MTVLPSTNSPTDICAPGSILLLSCYELGRQPLGLALPLGLLASQDYEPAAIDLAVQSLDESAARRALFVGISVPMHTALRLGLQVARRIRQLNPTCHICFYGLYAALNAPALLEDTADSCIGPDFEEPLLALLAAIRRGETGAVPGVSTLNHPAVRTVRRPPVVLPSREALLPLGSYSQLVEGATTRQAGYVEGSRGCLHLCRHCPIPAVYNGRFVVTSEAAVIDDIRRQVALGATHITFGDPDFLNGPGHSLRILRRAHQEFPSLTFDCTTKVEHILKHQELLPEMSDCGCIFIISAVESLSERVLKILDKGHSKADVISAIDVLDKAGIAIRPTWLPFTPWTTYEDYLEILDFVEEYGLIENIDPVQYSIRLLVPPGSLLLKHPEMQPHLHGLESEQFSYNWRHPDPRMDWLQREITTIIESNSGADSAFVFSLIHGVARSLNSDRSVSGISPVENPVGIEGGGKNAGAFPPVEWKAAAGANPGAPHSFKMECPSGLSSHLQSTRTRRRPLSRKPIPRFTEPWFC